MLAENKSVPVFSLRQMTVLLGLLGIILCGGVFYLAETMAHEVLQDKLEQIHINNRNTVRGVEKNIRLVLNEADTMLQLIKLDIETHGQLDAEHEKLLRRLVKLPAISSIEAIDAGGNRLFSIGVPADTQNFIRQDFFQSQKQYEFQELYIGVGQLADSASLILSRRLNDRRGNFNGVVSICLAKDSLLGIFQRLEFSCEKNIILLRRDQMLLDRYPRTRTEDGKPGQVMNHPVFEYIAQGKWSGEYEGVIPAEPGEYSSAYRVMSDYPLVVVVATSKNEVRQYWLKLQQKYRARAGVVSLAVFAAILIVWLQLRSQLAAVAVMRRKQQLLSTTLWYKRADAVLHQDKLCGRSKVVDEQEKPPRAAVLLEWQSEWESGHPDIDEQHRELLRRGNALIQMSLSGSKQDAVVAQLNQVVEHVVRHFAYEEQVMLTANYPDCQRHAQIHQKLVERAWQLKEDYLQGKLKTAAFLVFIVDDIIVEHMLTEDVKFFPYVHNGRMTDKA